MDITEIPIEVAPKKTKKVSQRTVRISRQWLQEKGIQLEHLNESQQDAVFRLMQQKRGITWMTVISIIAGLFYCFACFWFIKYILQDAFEFWVPASYTTENEQGEKTTQEISAQLQESVRLYGKLCMMFGAVLGGLLYMMASHIVGPFLSRREYKQNKKTIEAFLPAVTVVKENAALIEQMQTHKT